jgi:antagonist of KipI
MSVTIQKAGILDTLQDLGRRGYQQWGVNPGGAMDRFSMQVANILVGNEPEEAVIEIHFPASVFLFNRRALIAISGSNLTPVVNGQSVPNNQPIWMNEKDILEFKKPVDGSRTYLSLAGGWDIPVWLNSKSTHLKLMTGGWKGRGLQKADQLPFKKQWDDTSHNRRILPWKAGPDWGDEFNEIAVVPGREWPLLQEDAKKKFLEEPFLIRPESDRMGYRLAAKGMTMISSTEVLSTAVDFGTIQLLPDGSLMILMADHQTTGGYPRLAHVISAQLSRLAAQKPGDRISFCITDIDTAEKLWLKQQQHLQQLQNACTFRLEQYFHANRN